LIGSSSTTSTRSDTSGPPLVCRRRPPAEAEEPTMGDHVEEGEEGPGPPEGVSGGVGKGKPPGMGSRIAGVTGTSLPDSSIRTARRGVLAPSTSMTPEPFSGR
jgi:hypothetical protein